MKPEKCHHRIDHEKNIADARRRGVETEDLIGPCDWQDMSDEDYDVQNDLSPGQVGCPKHDLYFTDVTIWPQQTDGTIN